MRALPTRAALFAAVIAGAMVGVQARINGELATRMGSALEAAAASFVIGLLLLGLAMPSRVTALKRLTPQRVVWWWWLGGLGGAFLVSTTAHGVPKIGVALVSVCIVAGVSTGALLTDLFGLGPSGRHPASTWRFAGVLIVIAAVGIGAIGERGTSFQPVLYLLLFLAGAASAVQQAGNGQLRVVADDVVVASFVSFLGGSIALVAAVFVVGDFDVGAWPSAAWLYLGGPLGVVYIVAGAATVKAVGVLRFVLGAVAGQLLAAVVIDAVWPAPNTELRVATVIGAVVTVLGVWVSGRGERPQLAAS